MKRGQDPPYPHSGLSSSPAPTHKAWSPYRDQPCKFRDVQMVKATCLSGQRHFLKSWKWSWCIGCWVGGGLPRSWTRCSPTSWRPRADLRRSRTSELWEVRRSSAARGLCDSAVQGAGMPPSQEKWSTKILGGSAFKPRMMY